MTTKRLRLPSMPLSELPAMKALLARQPPSRDRPRPKRAAKAKRKAVTHDTAGPGDVLVIERPNSDQALLITAVVDPDLEATRQTLLAEATELKNEHARLRKSADPAGYIHFSRKLLDHAARLRALIDTLLLAHHHRSGSS